jgi:hypothetical protein
MRNVKLKGFYGKEDYHLKGCSIIYSPLRSTSVIPAKAGIQESQEKSVLDYFIPSDRQLSGTKI